MERERVIKERKRLRAVGGSVHGGAGADRRQGATEEPASPFCMAGSDDRTVFPQRQLLTG